MSFRKVSFRKRTTSYRALLRKETRKIFSRALPLQGTFAEGSCQFWECCDFPNFFLAEKPYFCKALSGVLILEGGVFTFCKRGLAIDGASYGVASVSWIDEIVGLFFKRAL